MIKVNIGLDHLKSYIQFVENKIIDTIHMYKILVLRNIINSELILLAIYSTDYTFLFDNDDTIRFTMFNASDVEYELVDIFSFNGTTFVLDLNNMNINSYTEIFGTKLYYIKNI